MNFLCLALKQTDSSRNCGDDPRPGVGELYPGALYDNFHVGLSPSNPRGRAGMALLVVFWLTSWLPVGQGAVQPGELHGFGPELNNDADVAFALAQRGLALEKKKSYAAALMAYQQALTLIGRGPVKASQAAIPLLTRISHIHLLRGEHSKAVEHMEEMVRLCKVHYPENRFKNGHPQMILALGNLGEVLRRSGKVAEARSYARQAYDMAVHIFPFKEFPFGHPSLADCLNNLGAALADGTDYPEAEKCYKESLRMQRLFCQQSKNPESLTHLAMTLSNLGHLCQREGAFVQAEDYYLQSKKVFEEIHPGEKHPKENLDLAILHMNLGVLFSQQGRYPPARQQYETALKLFPPELFQQGNPELAKLLHSLGVLLQKQGETALAKQRLNKSLEVFSRLYPGNEFPNGHPDIATCLDSLGNLARLEGNGDLAWKYFTRAKEMREAFSKSGDFPEGHPDLTASQNFLALWHKSQGNFTAAAQLFQEMVGMCRRQFPVERYPLGHPQILLALNNFGTALEGAGQWKEALGVYEEALAMARRLYHKGVSPHGHQETAITLNNLGFLRFKMRDYTKAAQAYEQALSIFLDLSAMVSLESSEAEALNFVRQFSVAQDGLLSVWPHTGAPADQIYGKLWRSRGAVLQVVSLRQKMLCENGDSEVKKLYQEYLDTRRQLNMPGEDGKPAEAEASRALAARQQALAEKKEQLERRLGQLVPEIQRAQGLAQHTHLELVNRLPADVAVVDLILYRRMEPVPEAEKTTALRAIPSYAAFVISRDGKVKMINLGPARRIEEALREWRANINKAAEWRAKIDVQQNPDPFPARLREWVWAPIETCFPAGTKTVYLVPDGGLHLMPWAALPGKSPEKVLLEEYVLTFLPHTPFLLEQMLQPPRAAAREELLLAVGSIEFGLPPSPVNPEALIPPLPKEALDSPVDSSPSEYRAFSDQLLASLQTTARGRNLAILKHTDASMARVLALLPRSRRVLFFTHGEYAPPWIEPVLEEKATDLLGEAELLRRRERDTIFRRNPFALTWLKMAGSSLPLSQDTLGKATADDGLLRAESIAGLYLPNLEMIDISACQIGLGNVSGGEGVFNFPRAFHQAGAANVVASLWNLPIGTTMAIKQRFHEKLFLEGKPIAQALHEGQLEELRKCRERVKKYPLARRLSGSEKEALARKEAKDWAGVFLSGFGSNQLEITPGQPLSPAPAHSATQEGQSRRFLLLSLLPVGVILFLFFIVFRRRQKRTPRPFPT